MITSTTWCTFGLCKGKTRETITDENSKTVKTQNPNIGTKDRNTKMEEAPKIGNTFGTEEAKEPTAAVRKTTKTLMETKLGPGTARRSKGIMDKDTGEDEETIEAVRPAEATTTQTIAHKHTKKGANAAETEARDLAGQDYDPIST